MEDLELDPIEDPQGLGNGGLEMESLDDAIAEEEQGLGLGLPVSSDYSDDPLADLVESGSNRAEKELENLDLPVGDDLEGDPFAGAEDDALEDVVI